MIDTVIMLIRQLGNRSAVRSCSNATLLLTVALCRWLNVAGLRCTGKRLHNPRKRRLMGRKHWDVRNYGLFSQFVVAAPRRAA